MAPFRQAVKISDETHAALKKLAAFASLNGWKSLGIKRDDPPSQASIIDEAIRLLATRMTKPRSTKR